MKHSDFSLSRRGFIGAALGTAASGILPLRGALAQQAATLGLKVIPLAIQLSPELPQSPIWAMTSDQPDAALRYTRGDDLSVLLSNEAMTTIGLSWLGFDGATDFEPLTGAAKIPASGQGKFTSSLRQAGTFLLDPRLFGDKSERPFSTAAVVVEGAKRSGAERDEMLLIEDWRIKPDGRALSPGQSADDTAIVYTVNQKPTATITLQQNERMRLRIINGCQRAPIGLKIENHEVRVMATDSQPAEPFIAQNGQLVLAPGGRIDTLIDATTAQGTTSNIILHDGTTPRIIARMVTSKDPPERTVPLPAAAALSSAHLPAQLDLKNAMRADIQLDAKAPWSAPAEFAVTAAPAFQVKRSRVVVATITNPTKTITAFRLHGHHFRLLDRLDDGWKPFWLDTLLLNAGQTQRIAFLAEYSGQWLIEATGIDWISPKLVRFYSVA